MLETNDETEVAVFGVVWIEGSMEEFVEAHKDIETFEKGDAVLAIQKIGRPPQLSDFSRMTFPEEDLDDLAGCKVGDCSVKADAQSLERLQSSVNWSAADAHDQANRVIRELAREGMVSYLQNGDSALGAYRDKKRPLFLDKEFDRLLANSPYLLEYDKEFHDYLDNFPNAELPGAEEFLYWSKVKFGLKPTVRMSHVVIYPKTDTEGIEYVIGSKMLYASHYFHTGLELKYLVRDLSRPEGGRLLPRQRQSEPLRRLDRVLRRHRPQPGPGRREGRDSRVRSRTPNASSRRPGTKPAARVASNPRVAPRVGRRVRFVVKVGAALTDHHVLRADVKSCGLAGPGPSAEPRRSSRRLRTASSQNSRRSRSTSSSNSLPKRPPRRRKSQVSLISSRNSLWMRVHSLPSRTKTVRDSRPSASNGRRSAPVMSGLITNGMRH